jgi:hypothetical protein
MMTGMASQLRINKKQRKKYRQWAAEYAARAETVKVVTPDRAASLQRISTLFARLGAPPHSKKRRTNSKTPISK